MIINKPLLAIAFATALSACSQPTAGTEQTAALSTQNAQETQHGSTPITIPACRWLHTPASTCSR